MEEEMLIDKISKIIDLPIEQIKFNMSFREIVEIMVDVYEEDMKKLHDLLESK